MTASAQSDPQDPRGHDLLDQRVASVWEVVREVLAHAPVGPVSLPAAGVVVTGVGSSEAHARYLVGLLNRWTSIPAEFVSLGAFADPSVLGPSRRERALIVFSQGLAPNSRLSLDRAGEFAGCVLFTSATEIGQRAAGRPERADLLARLIQHGAQVVRFPLEDEYTLLVRVLGPACGFAAARGFAAAVAGSLLSPAAGMADHLEPVETGPLSDRVTARLADRAEEHSQGFVMVVPAEVATCSQNLVAKFVEGLYWPAPRIVETLELAHGPFQQLIERPVPVWVLGSDVLSRRAAGMLADAGLDPFEVPLLGPPEVVPLMIELLFNPAIAHLVRSLDIDQVNWPGKGLDGSLYQFSGETR